MASANTSLHIYLLFTEVIIPSDIDSSYKVIVATFSVVVESHKVTSEYVIVSAPQNRTTWQNVLKFVQKKYY